jgi:hypothetical protein
MAQEDNLGLQPRLRLERRSHACSNKTRNEGIPPRLSDMPVHYVWIGFSAGTTLEYFQILSSRIIELGIQVFDFALERHQLSSHLAAGAPAFQRHSAARRRSSVSRGTRD